MLPLSLEAAMEIGKFRRWIGEMIKVGEDDEEIVRRVSEEYKISRRTAMSILNYIKEQYYFMDGLIPSDNLFLIEIYDEKEMRYFIFHMILGRRVLDALSRAYALVLSDLTGLDVRISTTDNGFSLAIPKLVDYKVIEEAIRLVRSNNLRDLLERAISRTEMLKRRFRYCAERSFMILKKYKGYETNIDRRQINSQRLLDAVSQITSFPVYRETLREIEEDYMDVPNAIRILDKIENGEIEFKIVPPQEVPSPFSHKILVKEYSDVVLMEDRRKILMMLHEEVMNTLKSRGYDVKLQMEIKDKGDGVPSE
jgi:Lhr-like helicases